MPCCFGNNAYRTSKAADRRHYARAVGTACAGRLSRDSLREPFAPCRVRPCSLSTRRRAGRHRAGSSSLDTLEIRVQTMLPTDIPEVAKDGRTDRYSAFHRPDHRPAAGARRVPHAVLVLDACRTIRSIGLSGVVSGSSGARCDDSLPLLIIFSPWRQATSLDRLSTTSASNSVLRETSSAGGEPDLTWCRFPSACNRSPAFGGDVVLDQRRPTPTSRREIVLKLSGRRRPPASTTTTAALLSASPSGRRVRAGSFGRSCDRELDALAGRRAERTPRPLTTVRPTARDAPGLRWPNKPRYELTPLATSASFGIACGA